MEGFFETIFLPIFAKAGIDVVPYQDYFQFHDMHYTHTPINGMGKPFGGVNMGRNIAMNVSFNVTHGHKHELYEYVQPKISHGGEVDGIHVICTGAFLPSGYREPYAAKSQSYWTSCLTMQRFVGGKYKSTSRVSIDELEVLYG